MHAVTASCGGLYSHQPIACSAPVGTRRCALPLTGRPTTGLGQAGLSIASPRAAWVHDVSTYSSCCSLTARAVSISCSSAYSSSSSGGQHALQPQQAAHAQSYFRQWQQQLHRRRQQLAPPLQARLMSAGDDADGMFDKSPQFLEGLSGWRRRWTIVLLCFMAFMLCNMDRVNMSIAVLPMSQQYGWNTQTIGLVQSSFFWGYLLTQVLGGIWADRFGGKVVLGLGVVWWSLATACTPIAAQAGLPTLLCARALMGVGEGVAMPAMNNLLSRWVPVAERSRSLALVYSGMFIGSIAGLALSPAMIAAMGWPSVFYIFGSLGIVWYSCWSSRAASTPADDTSISKAEKAYILANTNVSGKATLTIPWRQLLSRKEVWAIILCHFCHNWGTFILLTWMPTYYNQVFSC
eukprot:GHRR01028604.1.p1 GENE.GHRR01028604.1~~GHRR01028604.1.p1  ORF type:complete len:406 (+),score=128.53 GHRR01028604.1:292-1509(+)